jgi:hypothetical protein
MSASFSIFAFRLIPPTIPGGISAKKPKKPKLKYLSNYDLLILGSKFEIHQSLI